MRKTGKRRLFYYTLIHKSIINFYTLHIVILLSGYFVERKSGALKKNLSGEIAYLSFLPKPLPPEPKIETDGEMLNLIVRANREIACLLIGII